MSIIQKQVKKGVNFMDEEEIVLTEEQEKEFSNGKGEENEQLKFSNSKSAS